MLNSQEVLDLLQNIPKGYLKPDDDFFNASNSNIFKSYKKLGAISGTEYQDPKESSSPTSSHNLSNTEIFCNVMGCCMIFDNIASYQSHYNTMHRFICSECKKTLPTEHLLDLHISEQHDSYFNVRVEKGERLYKCYLEECKELFINPAERKEHCIKQHKLPSNFRFDQVAHKNNQHKGKKTQKMKSPTAEFMEIVEEQNPLEHKRVEIQTFSFGHQKERTFHLKNGPKPKQEPGKTLENMDTLKEVINAM